MFVGRLLGNKKYVYVLTIASYRPIKEASGLEIMFFGVLVENELQESMDRRTCGCDISELLGILL